MHYKIGVTCTMDMSYIPCCNNKTT